MREVNKERLSKQLKAQADMILIKSGPDLAQDTLDTCIALLRLAEETADLEQMDIVDRDSLTDSYQTVAEHVSTFIRKAGLDIEENDTFAQGSGERLEKLRNLRAKLAHDAQERSEEIKRISQDISTLKQTLYEKEEEKRGLEASKAGLIDSLEKYTPDLFADLENENQKLYDMLSDKKAEFEKAETNKLELESELQKIQSEIDTMPETLKVLRIKMDKLETKLMRIREANDTCNDEKQAEARAEISKLEKQLAEDKKTFTELTKHLEELKQCTIEYDSQTQTLETEAIDLINKTIRSMRPKLEEHQKRLNRIKEENAQIENSYSECNLLREQFDAWFASDVTPLDRLKDALESEGSIMLKGTLDLRNCEKIQSAITQIRNDLNYLDDILKRAAQAYGIDIQRLQRRALGRTPK